MGLSFSVAAPAGVEHRRWLRKTGGPTRVLHAMAAGAQITSAGLTDLISSSQTLAAKAEPTIVKGGLSIALTLHIDLAGLARLS